MLPSHGRCVGLVGLLAIAWGATRATADDRPSAAAIRPRGLSLLQGGGGLSLLRLEDVVKDLGLTDEQQSALQKLSESVHEQMNEVRSSLNSASPEQRQARLVEMEQQIAGKVAAVLNDQQRARLQEIKLQVLGPAALSYKDTADALKLSDEQLRTLADLAEARRMAVRDAIAAAGSDPAAARTKIAAIVKDSADKMLAVLTSQQREQFEKMKGKSLEFGAGGFSSLGTLGRRPTGGQAKPDSQPNSK